MEVNPKLLEYLESFLTPRRRELFDRVLDQRTNYFTVTTQDVYQLHNTSAVIRSCDIFGIQNVHVVEEVNLKKIDREIAMGAQKWVDVNRYTSTEDCIRELRKKGYNIVATSPHKGKSPQDFDISKPAALFFGTESTGLSEEVLEEADEFIHIPMYGFTESFNISVSAAIILQELTDRLRKSELNWHLSEEEKLEKRLDWTKKTLKSATEIIERFQASQ
ncbi:TrmH family RNA methyltransferase [Salinimicrobium soli]|uniref:TrmH family RNA methyltransferase n=1 Tax=Salinimicrobium soli TaxID=1254399 RepID=UPI003AAD699E